MIASDRLAPLPPNEMATSEMATNEMATDEMPTTGVKTAVLLSGGVDSSVALHRLLAEGYRDLTAFYLKIWLEDELAFLGECPWEDDLVHARAVCDAAGVPLEVVPMQQEYQQRIVAYTLTELRAGRTPSSDVLCNQQIKFGAFVDAVGEGFGAVASGHYARRVERDGRLWLARSPDPVKDQTYFLARLSAAQLERSRFPLGTLTKTEVRRQAVALGLPNRHRPDSQGICFLGQIPFRDFVRHHLGELPGEIRRAETGEVLGEHRGHWFHTIGQRKGLGLSGGPWYVVAKDPERNRLLVSHSEELWQRAPAELEVEDLHWIGEAPQDLQSGAPVTDLTVRLRHGGALLPCRLSPLPDGGARVELSKPDPGIAPGQFAVFYDGEICLGSGVVRASPMPFTS